MKNINVIKIGNSIKISINGKLHQKNCATSTEADKLFRLCLKAKENPTDENILDIRGYLNERTRVAMECGLEYDPETAEVFMAGFNTSIPDTLVSVIKEYHENGYPIKAVENFWRNLMLNPDKRVRTVLFDFIKTHDFVLTDAGYMVVYKAVYDHEEKKEVDTSFSEFVSNRYLHVKKTWKESPKNYVVYKDLNEDSFGITNIKTAEKWDEEDREIKVLGNLAELFDAIFNTNIEVEEKQNVPVYTDMHSNSMRIVLGEPVKMERKECDADFRRDCSNGLHVGATRYVENFANGSSTILVCYVNPANVVAVPDYDHSKMRVSEYFPFAVATYDNGKIDIIEQAYFESDYSEYEIEELEAQVEKLQAEELPIETAMNAEAEERQMSELMKIIESRLLDIE